MKRNTLATALALAASSSALTACTEAGGAWQGTIADSAGVSVVTNAGQGVWGANEGWTVERELAIGTAEGEPEYQFGQIAGIDVGSDGRIYVMDQQAKEVRVFDESGDFLATMGREGSGPGELSQAAGPVIVAAGDTVLVPDFGNQRITRYTAAGEPAGSVPLPMTQGIPTRWMEGPGQQLVQQAMVMQMPGQQDVEQKNLILRRNTRGEVTDTILELPFGGTMDFTGGQPRMTVFASEPVWAVAEDGGLVYGNNSEYRLNVLSPDGSLTRVVQMASQRKPLTEGDEAEFRRLIQDAWKKAGMPPQAMEMMSQALSFADYYPAYANLFGGPEGTIWVQSVQTPETVKETGATFDIQDIGGPAWDVFDDEGRFLGVVTMPGRFTPLLFKGDQIYGILRDDLDVQYAVRMKLNRGTVGAGED